MTTSPDTRPAAVAVPEEMVKAAAWALAQRRGVSILDEYDEYAFQAEARAALEAAAQVRSAQDHGGDGHAPDCALAALSSDHPAPEPGAEAGEAKKVEHPWLLRGQGDNGPESISYLDPEGWTDDIDEATGWPTRMAADATRAECSLEGITVEVVWAEHERAIRALQTPADGGRDG